MSKECTDRFDAGSRCRTGGRRMIRNRPDRTARGRISPRPGAATVRFAPQDTPPARIHSVRRTHTNEKPRRNSAGLLTDRSDIWRKRRDSNPRYPFEVYTLSRRAPSTARTLLLYLIPSETTRPQTISSERRGNVQIFSEFFPFSLRKIEFSTFIRSNGRLLLNPDSKNPIGISSRPFCYHFRLHTV